MRLPAVLSALILAGASLLPAPSAPSAEAQASDGQGGRASFAPLSSPATGIGAQASEPVPPGTRQGDHIEAELVPLSQWAAPGSTAVVAVRQKIANGWHTYWRNPGDSGGPTTLGWRLPEGVKAGEIVWPVPERQRLQDLVNYGYSDAVYLPVPIEIPASARPGTTLPLVVDALFMVCSDEMCVPEELSLRLDLPIREGAAPLEGRHGASVQAVMEAAPRPAAIDATVQLDKGVLTLSAVGGPLAGAELKRAHFFSFKGGEIDHAGDQTARRGPDGVTLTLPVGRGLRNGLTGPISGVLVTDAGAWEITATPGSALAGATGGAAISGEAGEGGGKAASTGLLAVLQAALFALIGGLILNLMPCVFPVLAMKAASLASTGGHVQEARRDGLLFGLGVLVTFAVLAGLLLALRAGGQAIGWGFQLQSPAVVAALALLMLAVGLNLSGVFHVGAGLQSAGSGPLSRLPGGTGAFFTGVLAVVVAAPCTAPFMAAALGAALLMPWYAALIVFLMLGVGLALPYVAISLSPALLRRFPRPGPWMDRLKGLLAFPMYGAALWLAWVFARQTGMDGLGLLLVAGLLSACGLWLLGLTQADRMAGKWNWITLAAGLVILLSGYTAAVLAARTPVIDGADTETRTALPSQPWSEAAVASAQAEGRAVLVNFTADWCVTCKINERAALSSPRVASALQDANAVYLVGDWTRRDDAITRELERHGRSGVPLYLLYPADGGAPRILPQLLTEGLVVDSLKAAR